MLKVFIGYYNKANSITLLGLFLALVSCFFVLNNNLRFSVIFLIMAGICDLFDGVVARKIKRTNEEKSFGIQLDTVADVVSFCVTPTLIVYLQVEAGWYVPVVCAFYIICGVIRLAYFNTLAVPDIPIKYYQGLPVTYISLILPIVLLFRSNMATIITYSIVGLLFILKLKIPKPGGIWYIFFPLIAIALIALWWCA